MEEQTFSEIKIGERFTHTRGEAIKVDNSHYRLLKDSPTSRSRRTSGSLKVNGQRSVPTKSQAKGLALNKAAISAGYPNWHQLELAVIRGDRVVING